MARCAKFHSTMYQLAAEPAFFAAIGLCCAMSLSAEPLLAEEGPAGVQWKQWRGENRDGISSDTGLKKSWKTSPPELAWKSAGIGVGYSSVSIDQQRIFTMGDLGKDQYVICLSLKDGSPLWKTKIGRGGGGGGYTGPRCTPTIDGDRVYAIGIHGALVCLEADGGKIVWQKEMRADLNGKMMSGWGYSESPLIDGDRLICTPGGKNSTIVALDKKSGKTIWSASFPYSGSRGKDGAGYSSIVISEARGVRQYVQLLGRGVISVRASDGKFLWGYDKIANGTANVPTPVVSGDYVFCSTGYGAGAALLKITGRRNALKAEEVYFLDSKKLQNHHGGMILVDGHIYAGHGHGKGFPTCVELKTGKVLWTKRGPGSGSAAIVYADGNLIFRYQNGLVALIGATPNGYEEKGTFKIPNVRNPSWPHPVIAGGKLYLREQKTLYCYDLRDTAQTKKRGPTPRK